MEIPREQVYKSTGQRIAWISHYLKSRFKHKERPRTQMLSKFFPENSVVFDIGAHFGYLAKEFCEVHNRSCTVYAFEPVEYTHSILKRVMRKHNNSYVVQNALSNKEETINISIPVKSSGKLGIGLSHFGTENDFDYILEPIKAIKMDSFVEKQQLSRLDFIKCDVEGAEFLVFKGGENSIDRFRPTVYCELVDIYTSRLGYKAQEILEFFRAKDYDAFSIDNNGNLTPQETIIEEVEDYIFIAQ